MIYAYLKFPNLLLDAQSITHQDQSIAIHHQGKIIQSSELAIAAGVIPGMTINMALTLYPNLLTQTYQPDAERRLLHRLALWAYQYSHQVAIWNKGLCIEVSKSKSLFGDLQALTQILKQTSASQNFKIQLAFGYTPEMAALFVKAGVRPKEQAFEKTLYRLAIDAAEIPIEYVKRLKNMGFRTIGDYFGSPSRARQARIHREIYLYFDAIAGRHQTSLTWFTCGAVRGARQENAPRRRRRRCDRLGGHDRLEAVLGVHRHLARRVLRGGERGGEGGQRRNCPALAAAATVFPAIRDDGDDSGGRDASARDDDDASLDGRRERQRRRRGVRPGSWRDACRSSTHLEDGDGGGI